MNRRSPAGPLPGSRTSRRQSIFGLVLVFALSASSCQAGDGPMATWRNWWLTPDQQGQRLFEQGSFLEAAETFDDPMRRGVAYYRGGEFEKAAVVFGRIGTPEAAFDRGNALLLLGRYDQAIESYGSALKMRPGWEIAEQNRDLAVARKARLAPPEGDEGGTGGEVEPDEIVFDDTGRVDRLGEEQTMEGAKAMSDEELRAAWLRRVQNDPAEFLRARFAYQLAREDAEEASDD